MMFISYVYRFLMYLSEKLDDGFHFVFLKIKIHLGKLFVPFGLKLK